MVIGIKDSVKLAGVSVIACCAVFVCTMLLNYNIDLEAVRTEIQTRAGMALYEGYVSMGKVTAAAVGGCLISTSAVMLLFYIKNYIDTHSKELGILKAMGYSSIKIAKHFWVFGLSIFSGCALGFILALLYLPAFCKIQNAEQLLPEVGVHFHPPLALLLIGIPTIAFAALSVLYALLKLKRPVLHLLKEKQEYKTKYRKRKKEAKDLSFLRSLTRNTVKSRKTLVFFIIFSAFCFSAMVQMSISMNRLANKSFAFMMITIGLVLAFVTLLLSLSSVVKGSSKTIAMMRVFGYEYHTCSKAILGGYRPFSYLGFAFGTLYQYGLLKMMMTFILADVEHAPEYSFDFKALVIAFAAFVMAYELIMCFYSLRIKTVSIKSIMSE